MKVNPHVRYFARQVSFRLNLIFAIAFLVTLTSCYVDFIHKKEIHPDIPWYGMFLKVQSPSWSQSSPFNK